MSEPVISISQKPENVSLEEIFSLIKAAHLDAKDKCGLVLNTSEMTFDEFEEKSKDGEFFTAFCDNTLAGVVYLEQLEIESWYHTGICGKIRFVAVHPEHQHKGIGTLLLVRAFQAAADKGLFVVTVSTAWENKAAIALYQSAGFTTVAYTNKTHIVIHLAKWTGACPYDNDRIDRELIAQLLESSESLQAKRMALKRKNETLKEKLKAEKENSSKLSLELLKADTKNKQLQKRLDGILNSRFWKATAVFHKDYN